MKIQFNTTFYSLIYLLTLFIVKNANSNVITNPEPMAVETIESVETMPAKFWSKINNNID